MGGRAVREQGMHGLMKLVNAVNVVFGFGFVLVK